MWGSSDVLAAPHTKSWLGSQMKMVVCNVRLCNLIIKLAASVKANALRPTKHVYMKSTGPTYLECRGRDADQRPSSTVMGMLGGWEVDMYIPKLQRVASFYLIHGILAIHHDHGQELAEATGHRG